MSRIMLALILLIPLLGHSTAEDSELVMYNRCGDDLMELMSKMCNDQFNSHFDRKRGVLNLFDYVDSMDDAAGAVFRPYHPRMNSLMATRRISRYVATECCLKPCFIGEIKAHCANSD